jgi:hypothetical protein
MDLEVALARARAELDEAEANFRAAQERMRKLEAARDGLEIAVEMYGGGRVEEPRHQDAPASGPGPAEVAEPRIPGSRSYDRLPGIPDPPSGTPKVELASAAIGDLLPDRSQNVGTNQIRARIAAAGYDLTYDQVHGALGWLEETHRVTHPGKGLWGLPDEVPETADMNGAAARRS